MKAHTNINSKINIFTTDKNFDYMFVDTFLNDLSYQEDLSQYKDLYDKEGKNLLYHAAGHNKSDLATRMVDQGFDVHSKSAIGGLNTLFWAAWHHKMPLVDKLRQKGASIRADIDKKVLSDLVSSFSNEELEHLPPLPAHIKFVERYNLEQKILSTGKASQR